MSTTSGITCLLIDAQNGNRKALDELLPLVYDELKRVAARQLAAERGNHTLQATALLHEAYIRLIDQHSVDWTNRAHFFSIASQMMRRILVNYAEAHAAKKRGDGKTVLSLDEINDFPQTGSTDVLFLDAALNRLHEFDPQQAKIIELKFFAGLTTEETAEILGVSDSTVKREWRIAKAWLATQLA